MIHLEYAYITLVALVLMAAGNIAVDHHVISYTTLFTAMFIVIGLCVIGAVVESIYYKRLEKKLKSTTD